MREVTISIESSEGAKLFIKKEQSNGGFDLTVWRSDATARKALTHYQTNMDALHDMGDIADRFVREIG